jgi:hypothetical protein
VNRIKRKAKWRTISIAYRVGCIPSSQDTQASLKNSFPIEARLRNLRMTACRRKAEF